MTARPDPVALDILRGSFVAITDEMGVSLQRSSYSPNIKHRQDYTCSLFVADRELIAQTAHQIGHLGAFPYIIKTTMQEHREDELRPGDQIICNDPYRGGTHIPDIIMIAPVFWEGALWGYVANLAHHADVGGMAPARCRARRPRSTRKGCGCSRSSWSAAASSRPT